MNNGTIQPLRVRLERRYFVDEAGCWIWTGAKTRGGYGILGRGRRGEGNILAHRAAYLLHRGEIPAGLEPDHLCRVRCCINPDHIELVTRRENMLRGMHPSAVARRTGICKRGHPRTPENLYVKGNGSTQCRPCRAMWQKERNRHGS